MCVCVPTHQNLMGLCWVGSQEDIKPPLGRRINQHASAGGGESRESCGTLQVFPSGGGGLRLHAAPMPCLIAGGDRHAPPSGTDSASPRGHLQTSGPFLCSKGSKARGAVFHHSLPVVTLMTSLFFFLAALSHLLTHLCKEIDFISAALICSWDPPHIQIRNRSKPKLQN